MDSLSFTVDVYTSNHGRLILEGDGFLSQVVNTAGTVKYEVKDGKLCIDGNETRVTQLSPWETVDKTRGNTVEENVTITVYYTPQNEAYLKGSFTNRPIYSPYTVLSTETGNVYSVREHVKNNSNGSLDEFGIPVPHRNECIIQNIETNIGKPFMKSELSEKLENGNLCAAIPIE